MSGKQARLLVHPFSHTQVIADRSRYSLPRSAEKEIANSSSGVAAAEESKDMDQILLPPARVETLCWVVKAEELCLAGSLPCACL
jgi:hypothetical protein